jgi:hypothetical protein
MKLTGKTKTNPPKEKFFPEELNYLISLPQPGLQY